jgi:L-ascorbate metabolism protein UlaG (beta-lactamase superfamily)
LSIGSFLRHFPEVPVLKPAALKGEAFLAEVKGAPKVSSGFHLWWLGQSGFLIQWQGKHLLFDPYLSDSLTKKYAATDKPHMRMTELVVAPEKLDFIDVVTSSHNHTDHLDPETLLPLTKANPELVMVCPDANRVTVRERSGLPDERIKGLDAGQSVSVAGFEFHAVPAAHEKLDKDKEGRHIYLGFVVKFGPWAIYHSGDTLLFDGMVDILKPYNVDVALLPINGRALERRVAGNLWGREAAQLAKDIGAQVVIPCHYDMFSFNTATTEEFEQECKRIGQGYKVLRNGERM